MKATLTAWESGSKQCKHNDSSAAGVGGSGRESDGGCCLCECTQLFMVAFGVYDDSIFPACQCCSPSDHGNRSEEIDTGADFTISGFPDLCTYPPAENRQINEEKREWSNISCQSLIIWLPVFMILLSKTWYYSCVILLSIFPFLATPHFIWLLVEIILGGESSR